MDDSKNTLGEHSDEALGRLKRAIGLAMGDRELEREGELDELRGKAKAAARAAAH